jgi:hypothetical protein
MATNQNFIFFIFLNLLFVSLVSGTDDGPLLQTPNTYEQEIPMAISLSDKLLQVITPDQVKCSAKILDLEQYSGIIQEQNNDLDTLVCDYVKSKSIPLIIEINNQSDKTISIDWERFSQGNYYSFFNPEETFLKIQRLEFTTTPLMFKFNELIELLSCYYDPEFDSSLSIYVETKAKNTLQKLRKEIQKQRKVSLKTKRRTQILKPHKTTHAFYWFKQQPIEPKIECKLPAPWTDRIFDKIGDPL